MRVTSAATMRQHMIYRRETNRSLAAKAGVGHAIVGHLSSGKRTTCTPETGAAIERALDVLPGLLFEAGDEREVRRYRAAADAWRPRPVMTNRRGRGESYPLARLTREAVAA